MKKYKLRNTHRLQTEDRKLKARNGKFIFDFQHCQKVFDIVSINAIIALSYFTLFDEKELGEDLKVHLSKTSKPLISLTEKKHFC